MGVFILKNRGKASPFYWLWLETAPRGEQKEKTDILIGTTVAQRKDSRLLAVAVYHQRMNELAKGIHRLPVEREQIRFDTYAAWYRVHKVGIDEQTFHRKGWRREGEMLDRLLEFFGEDLVSLIGTKRVAEYHTFRKPKAGARTINREVDLLKSMLRDAVPDYLEKSPLVGMKRLTIVPPRRRYVTLEEFDALLKVCEDAADTAILVLGRDTLTRLGDLLDLRHTDRDEHDARVVWVRDPKSGDPYEVVLSDRALAAVEALADNGSQYLFAKFRVAENPRDWPGSVRQRLEYLCRQADLKYGMKQHGVTFHWGTRRSGATDYLMKKKKPLKSVQAQGNWKRPDVLLGIYTEVSREDKLDLVDAKKKKRRKRA